MYSLLLHLKGAFIVTILITLTIEKMLISIDLIVLKRLKFKCKKHPVLKDAF